MAKRKSSKVVLSETFKIPHREHAPLLGRSGLALGLLDAIHVVYERIGGLQPDMEVQFTLTYSVRQPNQDKQSSGGTD